MLEICGWIQFGVARREKLEPIHVALLRRALRHKKVTFETLQDETGLPLYAISRAAKRLDERKLAKVRIDRPDKRQRWLRITKSGAECIWRIELEIARHVSRHAGVTSNDSKRYYNFTLHVWNATRFFSPSQVTIPRFYFPSGIKRSERIGPEQNQI
jgi:DNA-binding MarR family transcriptional regulator